MRYAVISDIHANLEALRAVLGRTAELGADRILCLGDVVGYNANPNECVDIVRSQAMTCILGNHDAVAAGLAEPDAFTPLARKAVSIRSRVSDERVLGPASERTKAAIKLLNVVGVPLLVALMGIVRLNARRRRGSEA